MFNYNLIISKINNLTTVKTGKVVDVSPPLIIPPFKWVPEELNAMFFFFGFFLGNAIFLDSSGKRG